MKHYISDIKKQAEKVTTAITGAEMREAVSSIRDNGRIL